MTLPLRERSEEPGSVRLPYYVFKWLRDVSVDRRKTASFTIGDLGLLAALLGMFVNRESLFRSGRFEEVDGELTLIVTTSGRQQFTLPTEINPDREHLGVGPGRIREKESLKTLRRNGFFDVEERSGEVRIRLGEKGKELLGEVDEKAAATAN